MVTVREAMKTAVEWCREGKVRRPTGLKAFIAALREIFVA